MMSQTDYKVNDLTEVKCNVIYTNYKGSYKAAIESFPQKAEELEDAQILSKCSKAVMLMFDDPHQCKEADLKCRLGFTFDDAAWGTILTKSEALRGMWSFARVCGDFVVAEVDNECPTDLGKVQGYLWKKYIPEKKITPKTGPFDYCIQKFDAWDGKPTKCYVMVPREK
eukprot:Blabericola_migrator_1__1084@NODE_1277_length_4911_cov_28_619116_g862_i0_p5_GENE_NODE_1277_length_4911_cov_28_619116_g862_i0NODE_1277_length_4911_cov_28_619116_g862_i0_p5_ORF_typecomplete_len169_score32_10_NODE_1277_length_4911_cov_28_619116_g862_i0222728